MTTIPESTLVGWCGRAMKTLSPLIERIEADIMGSDLLHADDTPIRRAGPLKARQGAWQRGQARPDLGLCAGVSH